MKHNPNLHSILNQKTTFLICLIVLFFGAVSCQKKYQVQTIKTALKGFSDTWESNNKTGNRLANAELFTDDGVLIRSGKVYVGKQQIGTFLVEQDAKMIFIHQEIKQVKSWFDKDLFVTVGIRNIVYIDPISADTLSSSVPAVNIFKIF